MTNRTIILTMMYGAFCTSVGFFLGWLFVKMFGG